MSSIINKKKIALHVIAIKGDF